MSTLLPRVSRVRRLVTEVLAVILVLMAVLIAVVVLPWLLGVLTALVTWTFMGGWVMMLYWLPR